jgi:TolB protein
MIGVALNDRGRSHLRRRGRTTAVVAILVATLLGCSSAGPSGSQPSGSNAVHGGLADLGLANVTTETGAARGTTIGPAGGTLSATGANGATYSLAIPAGALTKDTEVGLYPVAKVLGLPGGVSLSVGVQFSPDGLHLGLPATLTIGLPSGTDAARLVGLAWAGDARDAHLYPARDAGQTLTLSVFHFSGAGAGNPPPAPLTFLGECLNQLSMDQELEQLHATGVRDAGEYRTTLAGCYEHYVLPTMTASEQYAESHDRGFDPAVEGPTPAMEEASLDAYNAWLLDIDLVGAWLGTSFTVSPQLADSKVPARNLLRAWFDSLNDSCIATGDPGADRPLALAALIISAAALEHQGIAELWGVASISNKLDRETLLDDLCVQVVIDPSRSISGAKPGDAGTITIPVGYTIAGGPVRRDQDMRIDFGPTGSQIRTTDLVLSDSSETVRDDFTWTAGVDPLQIDILASFYRQPFQAIARFDRITKHSGPGKVAFVRLGGGGALVRALYLVDATGGEPVRVVDGVTGGIAWAPDGQRIAIDVTGSDGKPALEIVSRFIDPTKIPVVTPLAGSTGATFPAWSPDGTKLAFVLGGTGIWVMAADGSNPNPRQVTTHGLAPAWSPDGTQIAFTVATGPGLLEIHRIQADGSREVTLLKDPSLGPVRVAWSPDGPQLAFSGWVAPDGRYDIFVMDALGSTPRRLTSAAKGAGNFNPTWSPDGTKIAFIGDRDGRSQIYTMNADGTGVTQLTHSEGGNGEVAWQP